MHTEIDRGPDCPVCNVVWRLEKVEQHVETDPDR